LKRKTSPLRAAFLLTALSASLACAATTQSFQLTSAGSNTVLDGIYISPYTALINGVPTTVICDDFADEVALGETWQVTTSTVASLAPNVMWGTGSSSQQSYNEAAWLAGELLAPPNQSKMGAISYAIWAVFDPTGVKTWLKAYNDTTTYNSVFGSGGWLAQAAGQTYSPGQFSSISVFTPVAGTQSCCGLPQEFLDPPGPVSTPEPPALAILGIDFAALAVFVGFFRRHLAAKIN